VHAIAGDSLAARAGDSDIFLTAYIFLDTYLLPGAAARPQSSIVYLAAACERLVLSLSTVFNTCV